MYMRNEFHQFGSVLNVCRISIQYALTGNGDIWNLKILFLEKNLSIRIQVQVLCLTYDCNAMALSLQTFMYFNSKGCNLILALCETQVSKVNNCQRPTKSICQMTNVEENGSLNPFRNTYLLFQTFGYLLRKHSISINWRARFPMRTTIH